MSTHTGDDLPAPLATFAVQSGPRAGQNLAVRAPRVTLGRGAQNELVLDDDSISTTHAQLEYEHGGWRITDLNSTNGTYVENVRLAPAVPTPLPYGSVLRLGAVRLHFRPVENADPEAARAAFRPPPARAPLAARRRGFRLPVWVVALLLLLLALTVLVVRWTGAEPDAPARTPVQEPERLPSPTPTGS